MSITNLTSLAQLNQILSASKGKLSVIDFHATWCGPCRQIAPTFEQLAKKYTNVNFLKCDVDVAGDISSEYGVRAMPTFVFIKGRDKVETMQGANPSGLADAVRRHSAGTSASTTSAFSGKGHTLGSSSATSTTAGPAAAAEGVFNLDPRFKVLLGMVGIYLLIMYYT